MNALLLRFPFTIGKLTPLRLNSRALFVSGALSIVGLLVFSIFQVGLMVKDIYTVQEYQKTIKDLSRENKVLELNLSEKNSLVSLGDIIKNLDFQEVNNVRYIRVLDKQVGSR